MRPTRTTRTVDFSGPLLECDKCSLIWVPKGDWDDPCPSCSRAAPRAPDALRAAIEDKIAACEQFARLAEGFAAEAVMAPAHWTGADARARAMREAAEMMRAALRSGAPSDETGGAR